MNIISRHSFLMVLPLLLSVLVLSACADLKTANRAYKAGNYQEAYANYAPLAEFGIQEAQVALAKMYYEGQGVAKDPEKTRILLEKAAEADDSDVLYRLGRFYMGDDVAPAEHKKAVSYYERAAGLGHAGSLYQLGRIYQKGDIVRQDRDLAMDYFQKADRAGYRYAAYGIAEVHREKGQIKKAFEYYTKAIESDYPAAAYKLGLLYERGKDFPKDMKKAKYYYYQIAVGLGYDRASKALARLNK